MTHMDETFHEFFGDTGLRPQSRGQIFWLYTDEGSTIRLEHLAEPPKRVAGIPAGSLREKPRGKKAVADPPASYVTQCWCGLHTFGVPRADILAGVPWYCGPDCARLAPLSKEREGKVGRRPAGWPRRRYTPGPNRLSKRHPSDQVFPK